MPGPCSQPAGDKTRWNELNEIVCDIHFKCDMDITKTHEFITYRVWLARRYKLTTGKS